MNSDGNHPFEEADTKADQGNQHEQEKDLIARGGDAGNEITHPGDCSSDDAADVSKDSAQCTRLHFLFLLSERNDFMENRYHGCHQENTDKPNNRI